MHLSFKPEHIVSEKVSDETLAVALKEAFDKAIGNKKVKKHEELFLKNIEVQEPLLEKICNEIKEKIDFRSENFARLVEMIQSGITPEITICEYLGIEMSK